MKSITKRTSTSTSLSAPHQPMGDSIPQMRGGPRVSSYEPMPSSKFIDADSAPVLSKIPCDTHPDFIISNICTSLTCMTPLCAECIGAHTAFHQNNHSKSKIESILARRESSLKYVNNQQKLTHQLQQSVTQLLIPSTEGLRRQRHSAQILQAKSRIIEIVDSFFNELEHSIDLELHARTTNYTSISKSAAALNAKILASLESLNALEHSLSADNYVDIIAKIHSTEDTTTRNTQSLYSTLNALQAQYNQLDCFEVQFNETKLKELTGELSQLVRITQQQKQQIAATPQSTATTTTVLAMSPIKSVSNKVIASSAQSDYKFTTPQQQMIPRVLQFEQQQQHPLASTMKIEKYSNNQEQQQQQHIPLLNSKDHQILASGPTASSISQLRDRVSRSVHLLSQQQQSSQSSHKPTTSIASSPLIEMQQQQQQRFYATAAGLMKPQLPKTAQMQSQSNRSIQIDSTYTFANTSSTPTPRTLHLFQENTKSLLTLQFDNPSQHSPTISQRSLQILFRIPRLHISITTPLGEAYLTGGIDSQGQSINNVYRLNSQQATLETIQPMKHSRSKHGIAFCNGFIYVVGGQTSSIDQITDSCERFNTQTGNWEMISSLNLKCSNCCLSAFQNRYIYKFGGFIDRLNASNSIERYDTESNEWWEIPFNFVSSLVTPQILPHRATSAFQINHDEILLLAGADQSQMAFAKITKNSCNITTLQQSQLLPTANVIETTPIIIRGKLFVVQQIHSSPPGELRVYSFDVDGWKLVLGQQTQKHSNTFHSIVQQQIQQSHSSNQNQKQLSSMNPNRCSSMPRGFEL